MKGGNVVDWIVLTSFLFLHPAKMPQLVNPTVIIERAWSGE
jgi:hypothetical protein